jgi:hypothetical protein
VLRGHSFTRHEEAGFGECDAYARDESQHGPDPVHPRCRPSPSELPEMLCAAQRGEVIHAAARGRQVREAMADVIRREL